MTPSSAGRGVVGPRALGVLDRQQDRVGTWRRLLAAYDIERQLERGYTITLGPDGAVVRSVAELEAGSDAGHEVRGRAGPLDRRCHRVRPTTEGQT